MLGFMGSISLGTLLAIALAVWGIRRRARVAFPKQRWVARGAALFAASAAWPALLMLFGARAFFRESIPEPVQIFAMGMALGVGAWGVIEGLLALPRFARRALNLLRRRAKVAADHEAHGTAPERALENAGRRRLLAQAGFALPLIVVGTGLGGAAASRAAPVVTHLRHSVRRELTNLHGLTIAQVSDVHIGRYMDPARLDEIRDAVNAQDADIHVITGDLIDNHIEQVAEAQRFIKGLKPRRGQVFLCMGNHEYIAARNGGSEAVIKGLRDTGAQLLIDESQIVRVGGDHLHMLGIDYPTRNLTGRTTPESLALALKDIPDDGAPRVMLSHHPRTFAEILNHPVDLTLAGHTHGGQLKLGRIGDCALTPILAVDFFHNGHYVRNGRHLYVNAGAGGWLPVRVNCPPEITVVEFVAQA